MNKSLNQFLKTTVCLGGLSLILNACVKKKLDLNNLADQQLTPEIAIPLINTSFTIKDILKESDKDGNIVVDGNNFCTLVYKGNLLSVKGTDLIVLPSQNFSSTYNLTTPDVAVINTLPVGTTYSLSYSNTNTYNTSNGLILDEVTFKSGLLTLTINSSLQQNAVITISIPSATKNNVALTQIISIGSSASSVVKLDLAGYKFDMTKGGTTTNTFDVNYSVVITKTSNTSSIADSFTISQSLSNQSFSLIKGDIGQQVLSLGFDTVAISLFNNTLPGGANFRIRYATVKFDIENSYGIPIRINNLVLKPYGAGQTFVPSTMPLPSAYNSLDINAPTVIGASAFTSPPQIGGPNETDLNNIMNSKPKNFIYNATTISNPNGVPGKTSRNFVTDQSQFKVDMELKIPLDGAAWDFILADTIKFELGETDLDKINYLTIRNYVNNGFPFDVGVNIDFVDSAYKVKQVLNPNAIYSDVIPSANVDANGVVTSSNNKTTDFVFNKTQINNLKTVKYMILRAKGNTTNYTNTNIKIYANYKLDYKLGVKGELNLTTEN